MNGGREAAPSGVVTFLFTDIEVVDPTLGSRRRGDALCADDHDDTLRRAVATHGGRLFKHTGDGICPLARRGQSVTTAAMAAYALDAIERVERTSTNT